MRSFSSCTLDIIDLLAEFVLYRFLLLEVNILEFLFSQSKRGLTDCIILMILRNFMGLVHVKEGHYFFS